MPIQTNNLDKLPVSSTPTVFVEEFADIQGTKHIALSEGSDLHYLVLCHDKTELTLQIQSMGKQSQAHIACLCLWTSWSAITVDIRGVARHDYVSIDIHILSLLYDEAKVNITWGITIQPDIKQASGRLLEENIILGEHVQIKTLPMLDVRSNDVQASHGARIEKIDRKKLFYAQSRGLWEDQAKTMIIEGMVTDMIGMIPGEQERQEIFEHIIKSLHENRK